MNYEKRAKCKRKLKFIKKKGWSTQRVGGLRTSTRLDKCAVVVAPAHGNQRKH